VKHALTALACLFLAAHVPSFPDTLEDIDSVNFALAVRDFDVARHQPHPPGYPVYVALSKASTALLGGDDVPGAVVTGLAVWSTIAGAALVPLLFALFRAFDGTEHRAWWAMGITVTSPLFWFTALRPLSDMTGLAGAVAAQWLVVPILAGYTGRWPGRSLCAGAFIAGLAAGIRVQTAMLTLPLLVAAVVLRRHGGTWRIGLATVGSAIAGVCVWAVPLLAASGGPEGYLAALGSQASEDFSGVVMLWTTPSPRVAADAFTNTFLWPWGNLVLGGVVVGAAVVGAARLLLQDRRALLWLAVAFGPYAVFHLLFHETVTIRYALPLVPPVAYLGASAIGWGGRRTETVLSVAVIAMSMIVGVRAARAYGSSAAPAFEALRDVSAAAGQAPVGMHAVFRRAAEWFPPSTTLLSAPHGREWLALVERWKTEPRATLQFVADPRRTDLALFDPHARQLENAYRWPFQPQPYVGGARPGDTDWYSMRPPGWMLDRGWALSAELAGVAARDGAGPHNQPSIAWVQGRRGSSMLMVGGRNLHAEASSQVTVTRDDAVLGQWGISPGFFFHVAPVDAGVLQGEGYVPVIVRASGADAGSPPVSLEQFDLQPDGVPMVGFMEGWQEPEYSPATSRTWRWMSEGAALWVRPVGRDVTLTLVGESPLRYFESAPTVRITLGGQELTRVSPSADFAEQVVLPRALLESSQGKVVIESSHWFVPAEREASGDRRRLALRVYAVAVR
jgi:hypothetical protein